MHTMLVEILKHCRPTRRIDWGALNSNRAADEAEKWAGTYMFVHVHTC